MDTDFVYVSFAPCGCFNAVCVDMAAHKKDTGKFVGNCVRRGDRLERMPIEQYREQVSAWPFWPKCPHGANERLKAKQMLFEETAAGE